MKILVANLGSTSLKYRLFDRFGSLYGIVCFGRGRLILLVFLFRGCGRGHCLTGLDADLLPALVTLLAFDEFLWNGFLRRRLFLMLAGLCRSGLRLFS